MVILDAAPLDSPDAPGGMALGQPLTSGLESSDGRHVVLWDGAGWQRFWRRGGITGGPAAAVIICDAMMELRLQAASAFGRWIAGKACDVIPSARPTEYQARRLNMLLSIFDMRRALPQVTSHEIAERLIYPRLPIGRGVQWKSSSERRRTLRLSREAEALVASGYLGLLAGRTG